MAVRGIGGCANTFLPLSSGTYDIKVQLCGKSTSCRTDNTFFSRSRVALTKQLELCFHFAAGFYVIKAEYEANVSNKYAIDFYSWL